MHAQASSEPQGPQGVVIGTDMYGRTWVSTPQGDFPLPRTQSIRKPGMSATRKLRLQRTIGFTIATLMLLSYIAEKWVW